MKKVVIGSLVIVAIIFGIIFFNNETPGGGNKNVGTGGASGGASGGSDVKKAPGKQVTDAVGAQTTQPPKQADVVTQNTVKTSGVGSSAGQNPETVKPKLYISKSGETYPNSVTNSN